MEQFLNPLEVKALNDLKAIQRETIWKFGIDKAIESGDPNVFRSLIKQLKSQAADCAETMKNILGNAYDSVIVL